MQIPNGSLRPGDLIDDRALRDVSDDEFEHDAIAGRVVEVLRLSETPVNVALYGPWGSGKSSLYRLMTARFDREPTVAVARYDAWKYGGDSLKRNFISSMAVALDLEVKDFAQGLYEARREVRLDWKAFVRRNLRLFTWVLVVAILIAVGWAALTSLSGLADGRFWILFGNHLPKSLISLGTVVVAVGAAIGVLDGANVTIESSAPSSDEQFANTFKDLIDRAKKKHQVDRIVFFVDELDRCSPEEVVTTLTSLKTFLDEPGTAFVVAADRLVLEAALDQGLRQVTPARPDAPYYSTSGAFLEKIFQYQFSLPPLRERALTGYARDLVANRSGLWAQISDSNSTSLDEVTYVLVPAHVRSPRRVKALLNAFATSCRVAEARGIDWLNRVLEIAQLTTLETEFPEVARELLVHPTLLTALRDAGGTDTAKALAARFKDGDTPADLIAQPHTASADVRRASSDLYKQLVAYLARVAVTAADDPSPDLFYLQQAGGAQRFSTESAARAVDFATENAPSETIEVFNGSDVRDRILAVEVMVSMAETSFGPGKANVLEAASTLSLGVPEAQLTAIAERVKPSLIQSSRDGAVRDAAAPGIVRLLAMANADPHDIMTVIEGHEKHLDTLTTAIEFADRLESETRALAGVLGSAILSGEYVIVDSIVSDAPMSTVLALFNATSGTVLDAMEASIEEVPATRTVEALTDVSVAESMLERLAARAKRRSDVLGLTTAVLQFALDSDVDEIRQAGLERAKADIEAVPAGPDRSQLALRAIALQTVDDIGFWADHVSQGSDEEMRGVVLQLLEAVRTSTESSAAVELASVAEEFTSRVGPSIDAPSLETAVRNLLGETHWLKGTASRAASAYGTVRSLASIMGDDRVSTILAADLAAEVGAGTFSNDGVAILRAELAASNKQVSVLLADKLEDESLAISSAAAEAEFIVVGLAGRRTSRQLSDIESGDHVDHPPVVAAWLRAHPESSSVIGYFRLNMPPVSAIRLYMKEASDFEAEAAWLEAERLNWPRGHLSALARPATAPAACAQLRDRVVSSSRAEERETAADRLMTIRFDAGSPGGDDLAQIALELLSSGVQSNEAIAARLICYINGIPRGWKTKLAKAFDAAAKRHKRAFSATQSKNLSRLGVLASRKGFLGR